MKERIKYIIIVMIMMSGLVMPVIQGCNRLQNSEEIGMEQKKNLEDEISMAYTRLNNAFGVSESGGLRIATEYKELHEASEYSGVHWHVFLRLRIYESRTGIYLSYEKVVDYFSEEFEPDGTLRLYNNGLHPEIKAYVDWFNDEVNWRVDGGDFFRRVFEIYGDSLGVYRNQHQQEEVTIKFRRLRDLSPEMLSAIARKAEEPDYELDLIDLQRRGYGIFVENPYWEMD